jgi:hypothetical protein
MGARDRADPYRLRDGYTNEELHGVCLELDRALAVDVVKLRAEREAALAVRVKLKELAEAIIAFADNEPTAMDSLDRRVVLKSMQAIDSTVSGSVDDAWYRLTEDLRRGPEMSAVGQKHPDGWRVTFAIRFLLRRGVKPAHIVNAVEARFGKWAKEAIPDHAPGSEGARLVIKDRVKAARKYERDRARRRVRPSG